MAEAATQYAQQSEMAARLRQQQFLAQQNHHPQVTQRTAQTAATGMKAAGTGMQVAGTGMQVAGGAVQAGGRGAQMAGKGMGAAGAGMASAGAALSSTGIGAIAGVPLMGLGGLTKGAGLGAQAAGKGMEAGGQAARQAGKTVSKTGQSVKDTGSKIDTANQLKARENEEEEDQIPNSSSNLNSRRNNRAPTKSSDIGMETTGKGSKDRSQTPSQIGSALGERKALAQAPQAAPIRPTPSLNLPAQASDPAGQLNANKQAARTVPQSSDPLASSASKRDAKGQLNSQRQATRQSKQEAKQDKKQQAQKSAARKGGHAKRDQVNHQIDRSLLPLMVDFSFGTILGLAWFNLQLIWGSMVKKGKSRFLSPPSFQAWKIPILPDSLARASIVLADLIVLLIVLIIGAMILIIIGFIAMAAEGSIEAIQFLLENLGNFIF
ncbi:hypothetical protein KJ611_03825 [Patescibacteria group bacterium]|nr:hypothetical protein [Patescibacteria group bacterium]MBU1705717.1 hypothetical protein [Patescibacteria group bacterium]